jgi:hypothetical protein
MEAVSKVNAASETRQALARGRTKNQPLERAGGDKFVVFDTFFTWYSLGAGV